MAFNKSAREEKNISKQTNESNTLMKPPDRFPIWNAIKNVLMPFSALLAYLDRRCYCLYWWQTCIRLKMLQTIFSARHRSNKTTQKMWCWVWAKKKQTNNSINNAQKTTIPFRFHRHGACTRIVSIRSPYGCVYGLNLRRSNGKQLIDLCLSSLINLKKKWQMKFMA